MRSPVLKYVPSYGKSFCKNKSRAAEEGGYLNF